ncbi:MAG TPA: EamA family transporter [Candidatus Eisenbacteria bacterium]|jgi:drug/metabolite transporter (DMT)-like permease
MPTETPSSRGLTTFAAFAGCCVVWGSTFLVISIGDDTVPPLWAATLRLALAAVLLTLLTWLSGRSLPRGAALRSAAGFGFLNFGLSFCLLYWGEKTVPSGLAAVLYGTVPLTTALFARAFELERLHAPRIAGALVALAGIAAMFSGELAARVSPLPLAAIFAAATAASASGVVLKRGPRQHPLGANAAGAMVGLPVCGAASFLAGEPHTMPATAPALVPILYLTIMGSVVAFVLYAWLVNRWDVTRISLIAVVVPLVALVLGAALRHERLTTPQLVGSLLVLAGLAIALAGGRRRAPAPSAALAGAREA